MTVGFGKDRSEIPLPTPEILCKGSGMFVQGCEFSNFNARESFHRGISKWLLANYRIKKRN